MTQDTKAPTLAEKLRDQLAAQIAAGTFKPGDRLPSEAMLGEEHGVSRTVIREAIAALRGDGLVMPKRGSGVFVLSQSPRPLVPLQGVDTARLSSMIELLELRTGIEVEAAGLAAQRCGPKEEELILSALAQLRDATQGDHEADFNLHLSIAEATHNPRFPEMLHMLGAQMIPRHAVSDAPESLTPEYAALLASEHEDIVQAILDKDEAGARSAMRVHLKGAQARYRRLLREQ